METKRNRIAINVEDIVFDKLEKLVERHGISMSELVRSLIVEELWRTNMLEEVEMKRLLGIRA